MLINELLFDEIEEGIFVGLEFNTCDDDSMTNLSQVSLDLSSFALSDQEEEKEERLGDSKSSDRWSTSESSWYDFSPRIPRKQDDTHLESNESQAIFALL